MLAIGRMQRQPRHGVHQHRLAERRTAPRTPLAIDRGFHVHERQRHKLGEAAGFLLQRANAQQMPAPMFVTIDMAEHDGRRALQSGAMSRTHHLQPARGGDLVRADDGADFVVEDFGRGSRQRAETGAAQLRQEFGNRHAERLRAVMNLERRERMDVHPRRRLLHRSADIEIGLPRIRRMDAALHADFGGAARPRFADPRADFAVGKLVGTPAQVLAGLAFGERAELTAIRADVGVVDVARNHIGHRIAADARHADRRRPRSRRRMHRRESGTARRCRARPERGRSRRGPAVWIDCSQRSPVSTPPRCFVLRQAARPHRASTHRCAASRRHRRHGARQFADQDRPSDRAREHIADRSQAARQAACPKHGTPLPAPIAAATALPD